MLDQFDRSLLRELQIDASRPTAELAEVVGLSQSPVWRRIQKLRADGIIRAQVALLDRRKLGLNAQIFAQVRLNAHGRSRLDEFATAITGFPEVLECHLLIGAIDFLLRIVTSDIDAYESFFFDKLSRVPGVQEVTSIVALSTIKSTTALPIG